MPPAPLPILSEAVHPEAEQAPTSCAGSALLVIRNVHGDIAQAPSLRTMPHCPRPSRPQPLLNLVASANRFCPSTTPSSWLSAFPLHSTGSLPGGPLLASRPPASLLTSNSSAVRRLPSWPPPAALLRLLSLRCRRLRPLPFPAHPPASPPIGAANAGAAAAETGAAAPAAAPRRPHQGGGAPLCGPRPRLPRCLPSTFCLFFSFSSRLPAAGSVWKEEDRLV